MTREEARDECIKIAAFAVSEKQKNAMLIAAEALEQEPTTTVLQKMRQEIDSHGIIMQISNGEKIIGESVYIAKEIVLEIIDKYIGAEEQG